MYIKYEIYKENEKIGLDHKHIFSINFLLEY